MKRLQIFTLFFLAILSISTPWMSYADSDLLSKEENLWLASRNNTVIVYPEKNFPPFSYQNSAGTPQGLSIDYIELIAKKLHMKIEYLPARSRFQILDEVGQNKKGDIVTSLTDTKEREDILYFTDTYVTVPAVIVVRKDIEVGHTLTLGDLTGKKVAIGDKYAVEDFVRVNNPRIVIESVVDDESGLQQVVLGEVDAAVMDMASLSYYLSKQVLNSVKVVGSTGFEYKLAFAVPKDKAVLQSILDKGLQQVSTQDRQIFNDKWISYPQEKQTGTESFFATFTDNITLTIGIACFVVLLIILFMKRKHSYLFSRIYHKAEVTRELEEQMAELEHASKGLVEELNEVKSLEEDIKEKIKSIEK